MLDLKTIDPETVLASSELDALIAEKWMGWRQCPPGLWITGDGVGECRRGSDWTPSINPAHAGEARRKAGLNGVKHHGLCTVAAFVAGNDDIDGHCDYSETNGDKGKAEALATCRAIVATLKANQAAGGE